MTETQSERRGRVKSNSAALTALAPRLRRLRAAYGTMIHHQNFSMAAMARVLDVEEERYRTWERGLREPPLWILLKIKHLTGFSIDSLLTGAISPPGQEIYIPDIEDFEQRWAMAQRIRWVRELREPDIEAAAEAMAVRPDILRHWELGLEQPSLRLLAEFAGRFNVSLDFLYSGRLIGVDPALESALLAYHPELRPPEPPAIAAPPYIYKANANASDPGNTGR
jgi:transcriptional regulator with XRE-family HTH domain